MNDYIVLGVGSKSDMEAVKRPYDSLDGKTIDEYLTEKGIKHLPEPFMVSCHRTPKRVPAYANDCENLAMRTGDGPGKVVVVLFGGLSLALPGIFSSEMITVPVIGVPAYSSYVNGGGLDSSTAVYNLPPGTVVGGAPLHSDDSPSLDKAIRIAEKMLRLEPRVEPLRVSFISSGHASKPSVAVRNLLDAREEAPGSEPRGFFGITYREQLFAKHNERFELLLNLADDNSEIAQCDARSDLALQCKLGKHRSKKREEYAEFVDTVETLAGTHNTLYFSNPENAALFLVRALALHSATMRRKLEEHRLMRLNEIEKKYGMQIKICPEKFK